MRRQPAARRGLMALFAALALLLVACGDDDAAAPSDSTPEDQATPADNASDAEATPTDAEPTPAPDTVDAERPEAIISLSPTATEILFAIGAGDQVLAVDTLSNHPGEAPVSDLGAFEPNVEAIAGMGPDLVVLSFDPGDVVANLEALGIPTIVQVAATSLDDTYQQIEELGAATGHEAGATRLVAQMQGDMADLVASVPAADEPLTFFHEVDDTLYTVTSASFIGEIYSLAGLVNIADSAQGAESGFPQLSAEYLLDQDPDVVFLADTKCCGQTVALFGARPGFDQLTAVQAGNVVELDDDIASRWGPRVVELLEAVVSGATGVEAE